MTAREQVVRQLNALDIEYEMHEHPPVPTVEEALPHWKNIEATHCKNLFFRNHKGNRHYLVILRHDRQLNIRDLEQRLKQGKISFASPERLKKHLGLEGGSVSLFGILNDREDHVHVFLDEALESVEKISFHPNENSATLVITNASFKKFLNWSGNPYEFIRLYD
ncbi:MAG: prolyl-tRNA synthetase associated domain-containing protein [Bacteroidales bacterium]